MVLNQLTFITKFLLQHQHGMNIPAIHRHVVRIAIVANIMVKQCAHVNQITLGLHHNADLSVSLALNVQQKKHALITNVQTHVHILVELVLFVIQAITIQFVRVPQGLPAIHLLNVLVFVSFVL